MNPVTRFFVLGMQDADRRVEAMLSPQPLESTDQYLKGSALIAAVDSMTHRLQAWWAASVSGHLGTTIKETFSNAPPSERAQAIGTIALTAAAVHAVLTILNGARPGWFWMIIPALAVVFGVLALAGRPR